MSRENARLDPAASSAVLAKIGKASRKRAHRREHDFGRVFTSLLFVLFVVTLLTAILVGTDVYRSLNRQGALADDYRLSLTLLANDVRANDQIDAVARAWVTEGTVEVEMAEIDGTTGRPILAENEREVTGSLLQGPALVLRETLPGGVYETRIYRYKNTIRQEYVPAETPYDPEGAIVIVKSSVFSFTYEKGLLTIVTDAGEVSVALRCEGGER